MEIKKRDYSKPKLSIFEVTVLRNILSASQATTAEAFISGEEDLNNDFE